MDADFGGANDGQCEYSFFSRCPNDTVPEIGPLTFGQQHGWTYRYCPHHYQLLYEDSDTYRMIKGFLQDGEDRGH